MFSFFKNKFDYLSVFLLAFLFFSFLQSPQVLPDPDAFYHAKIAKFVSQGKILKTFPYLQYTTLNDGFVDHHFLYHLLLIPFVKFFQPLAGIKIGQAFLTSAFIALFYWFIKREKIKWPIFWTAVLTLNSPFVFRTLLIKANSLSLILLFFGIYFIFNKKYLPLFVISYLYVLAYGGWPLILAAIFIYIVSGIVGKIFLAGKKIKKEPFFVGMSERKILLSVFGGILSGLVVNPYSPKNLYFYFQQVIQIGIINYSDILNVGGEWSGYPAEELVQSSGIVFIALFLGLIFFITSLKKQNEKSLSFLFLTLLFFGATLKSRRYVEYFIPFSIFFSAISLNLFLKDEVWKDVRFLILNFYSKKRAAAVALALTIGLGIFFMALADERVTKKDLSNGSNFSLYENSAEFLKENSKAGDIIFQADWDDFPALFYHNDKNYYIVGLDPTFMYNYDKGLYYEYAAITTGADRENIYGKIKNDFKADFVFLDTAHLNFNDNLIRDSGFEFLYKDSEALIYRVR